LPLHEAAKALVGDRRHEREAQLAGGQQAGQADRVAAVGLDPLARALGIDPGATTLTLMPRSRAARARPNPVRPAS
jgi:hypothetical protein